LVADGWNGNTLTLDGNDYTLENGNYDHICVDVASHAQGYYQYSCGGGSWTTEASITLTCGDNAYTGECVENGCVGNTCSGSGGDNNNNNDSSGDNNSGGSEEPAVPDDDTADDTTDEDALDKDDETTQAVSDDNNGGAAENPSAVITTEEPYMCAANQCILHLANKAGENGWGENTLNIANQIYTLADSLAEEDICIDAFTAVVSAAGSSLQYECGGPSFPPPGLIDMEFSVQCGVDGPVIDVPQCTVSPGTSYGMGCINFADDNTVCPEDVDWAAVYEQLGVDAPQFASLMGINIPETVPPQLSTVAAFYMPESEDGEFGSENSTEYEESYADGGDNSTGANSGAVSSTRNLSVFGLVTMVFVALLTFFKAL
jgi:hypothetical protein